MITRATVPAVRAMVGVLAVCVIVLGGCGGEPAASSSAAAGTTSAAVPASPSSDTSANTEAPSPVATPAAADVVAYTVVQPKTLLGRAAATEAAIKDQGVKVGAAWGVPAGGTKVSGAYGSTGKKNVVVFAASTADIADPAAFVEQLTLQGFAKYSFRLVDAGPMRGAARCADSPNAGVPDTLCLWADTYATGVIHFLYGAAADAERLLPQARAEIEVDKNK
jgi:hypothetical protein